MLKLIARNVVRMKMGIKLRKTVHIAEVHFDVKYRYARYANFPVARWDNLCDFLSGKGNPIIMKTVVTTFLPFFSLNHSCPFKANEVIVFAVDRYHVDSYEFNYFIPAGDYRINITATEGLKRNMVVTVELFFSISDHRLLQ